MCRSTNITVVLYIAAYTACSIRVIEHTDVAVNDSGTDDANHSRLASVVVDDWHICVSQGR